MSYEILYAKQFIRVRDGIIPLVLTGSNNCWDGNRRARDWSLGFNFYYKDVVLKEESIIRLLEEKLDENIDYIEINGKRSKQSIINFYKNGVKNALSIEDINERYFNDLRGIIQVYYEDIDPYYERFKTEKTMIFKTTEDLEAFINDFKELEKTSDKRVFLTLRYDVEDKLSLKWQYRQQQKQNKDSKPKEKNYVVNLKGYGYVLKITKRGLQYTASKASAMSFEKETQAIKYIEKLESKMGSNYSFEVASFN